MDTLAVIYLVAINVLAFTTYGIDKYKAIYNRWRIPEYVLLCMALLGGAVGAFIGMKVFQHKTSVPRFYITVPVLLILQVALYLYFYIQVYNRL